MIGPKRAPAGKGGVVPRCPNQAEAKLGVALAPAVCWLFGDDCAHARGNNLAGQDADALALRQQVRQERRLPRFPDTREERNLAGSEKPVPDPLLRTCRLVQLSGFDKRE